MKRLQQRSKARELKVDGESFIVDWSDPVYSVQKNAFIEATTSIEKLLESYFVPQRNHHSTIVSKRLDPIDRPQGSRSTIWKDPDFSLCRNLFRKYLHSFPIELQLCVCASGGTIQLVYRNEMQMPKVRQELIEIGAEVKPGTLDGDRMNTCTVVLGYLIQLPEREITNHEIAVAIAHVPVLIQMNCVSLVQ